MSTFDHSLDTRNKKTTHPDHSNISEISDFRASHPKNNYLFPTTQPKCNLNMHRTNSVEHFMNHVGNNMFKGDMARSYNARTGGCNIMLANHLVSLVTPSLPPNSSPLRILDNGCGPAVLTTVCLQSDAITKHKDVHLSAVDLSDDFITANQAVIDSTPSWTTNGKKVDTAVMNGMDLKFPDNTFDISFTSLAIFAFPNPIKGASELYRTLKPGGVAAVTTWKEVGWLPLLHECEDIVRPGAKKTIFPFLAPWQVPGKLESVLREGGFTDVTESEMVAYAWFDGDEKAVKDLTATLKPMVGSGWTDEEKGKMDGGLLEVLRGGSRHVLRGEGGRVGFELVAFTGVGKK